MDKDFEVNKIATDKVPDIPQNEKDISYYQDEIQRRLIRYTNIKIQGMGFRNYVPSQTFIPIKPDTAENVPMEPIFCEVKPDPVPEIREEIVDTPDAIIEEIPEEKEIEPKQEEVSLEPEMPELGDAFVGVFTEFSREVENIPPEEPPEEPRVRMPKARKVTVRKITKKSDAEESSDSTLFDNVDLLDDAAQIEEDLNFGNEEKIIKKFPIAAKEKVDTQDNAKPRVRVVKIESKSEPFEVKPVEAVSPIKNETPVPTPKPIRRRKYLLPTLDLLNEVNKDVLSNGDSLKQEAEENAEKLTSTLKNFGIGVTVTGVTRGPTVTRFEFKPDEGIKISRIVSLTDDLALSLAASAVRMEAPIPGKPAIGIEIPNKKSDTVFIREVLSSSEYRDAKSKLSVAIGKDIDGKTIICDIARMPHLLIAGSTGSGKSVCINTMIMGILFKANPEEVKFIMIDPKVVELGIYNSIPHLLIPVVTEPKKASAALAWAVMDVERRYKLFAENNVRDLASYNKLIDEKPELAGEKKIPQIVIIIDELADLMMVCSQDVEKSIIRLAQKARAAGVHLVIATQRPSVDVITGIIKANIPSRVAFAVASQFDSRTILDTAGAEKLLGRGDMLYHPLGFTKSARLQCAFVSDEEVEHVVEFIKDNNGVPEFDENVTNAIDQAVQQSQKDKPKDGEPSDNEDTDKDMDYILEAAEIAFAQGALSTSSIQRRLKLGYSRAARIVDSLEEMGLLSQSEGSKPRQVLLTKEEWEEIINEK